MNLFIRLLLLVGSVLIFLIGILFQEPKILLISVIIIFLHNIVYSLKDFNRYILFFCFNITFFVFLISRMVVTEFFGYKVDSSGIFGLNFNDESIVIIINICLYLSLIGIFIGYVIFKRLNFSLLEKKKETNLVFINSLRIFSLTYFFITAGIRLVYYMQVRHIVTDYGYYETFLSVKTSMPSILIMISGTIDVAFFSYLATMPSKKKSIFPITIYLGLGFLAALTGRRSDFMLSVLIILVYFCIRSIPNVRKEITEKKKEIQEKKWLGKFEIILGIIIGPLLIVFMTVIGYLRTGENKETSFLESIQEFFFSQGVSANIIGYTEIYSDLIPNKLYTVGPIIEFVDNNIIRPLTGRPELLGQSVERALDGFSYSHTISYFIMPDLYLRGRGYGSSFVAELFHDFSFVGVFVGSIVYGGVIFVLYYMLMNSNYFIFLCAILMTKSLFFTPRDQYLSFIADAFPPTNLAAIGFILIGAKLLQSVLENRIFVQSNRNEIMN